MVTLFFLWGNDFSEHPELTQVSSTGTAPEGRCNRKRPPLKTPPTWRPVDPPKVEGFEDELNH